MSSCAVFNFSTDEDVRFELAFTGIVFTGKTLSMTVRYRPTNAVQATLAMGTGLTLTDGSTVEARVAKAVMASWPRGEYTADLTDVTSGRAERLIPVRLLLDEPGRLPCLSPGRAALIAYSKTQAIVTAYQGRTGERGPQGPPNTLTIGTVTARAPGEGHTATITGTSPDQVLNLGIERGIDGIGAPTTPDILAIPRLNAHISKLAALGVTDELSLSLGFDRGALYARGGYVGASFAAMIAALGPPSWLARAGVGWYFDGASWQQAASGVPRIHTDPVTGRRGLLLETASTNYITNCTMAGASVGTPGVTPSNWLLTPQPVSWFTRHVVALGVEDGLPYIDLRIFGTTTGGSTHVIRPVTNAGVTVTAGNQWTGSFYAKIIAGTQSEAAWISVTERNAAGVVLEASSTSFTPPTSGRLAACRFSHTRVMTNAQQVSTELNLTFAAATTFDLTIRVACPQLEPLPFATSPIISNGAATARAVESFRLNTAPWVNAAAGSLVVRRQIIGQPLVVTNTSLTLTIAASGDTGMATRVVSSPGGTPYSDVSIRDAANTPLWDGPNRGFTPPSVRSAVSYDALGFGQATNGTYDLLALPDSVPPIASLHITGNSFAQIIEGIDYYPVRLSATELQALTDPANWS